MVRIYWALLMGIALLPVRALGQEAPTVVTTLPHPSLAEPSNFDDGNGHLLRGDPLLEPAIAPPGWVIAIEAGLFKPHIKGNVSGRVNVGGLFIDPTVQLPNAALDWAAGPRIELGYRFPQALGEILVAYRSLVSEGEAFVIGMDPVGPVPLHSRLNLNVLDLDYAQRECGMGPQWDMKWKAGARLASVYYDSRAVGPLVERRVSNSYLGAGPHAGLELWRYLGCSGLSVYGRVEGAALWGQLGQDYGEAVALAGSRIGGASRLSETQGVLLVDFQCGLAWSPARESPWRIACGYQIESWWQVGHTDDSRGDLKAQGIFLRGEYGY